MMNTADIALSPDELAVLDELLLSEDEEFLAIDEAHGYLTALLVSNTATDETSVLAAILGDAPRPENITTLLLKMQREIAAELATAKPFEPLVIEEEENGETFEVYEGWCYGFMLAVADHEERWNELPREQKSLLEPIATLALLREEELDMDDEEYSGWVGLLAGSVSGLYAWWH